MSFDGKNILIAGGNSGIGLSVIKLLNQGGANIYIVARKRSDEWPANVNYIEADVTGNLDQLAAFLPQTLDGLVYAIGSINLKPFSRLTTDDFLNDFTLNVLGAMRIVQQSLKQLKGAASASIILMSSVAAKIGMPYHASVAAAKGALEGFALSLSAELASQNIRVNVVAPSLTDTPMAQNLLNTPEKKEASAKRHPIGRYGNPEDISEAIVFLLSDKSTWITGQIIGVDGGMGSLKTI